MLRYDELFLNFYTVKLVPCQLNLLAEIFLTTFAGIYFGL